jgi:peptidyl-prolyl cis-trans isomerase B (cyclophilin B)
MIQGGCPEGSGYGGPGYCIPGEFSSNNFENNLKHEKGVISMARSMDPDSAGSQFFYNGEKSPHLDGQYAAFGKVMKALKLPTR